MLYIIYVIVLLYLPPEVFVMTCAGSVLTYGGLGKIGSLNNN